MLEEGRTPARRSTRAGSGRAGKARETASPAFRGRYASAGPYEGEEGSYEVRLERVPGGIRLAEWDGSGLRRRAPVLHAADVARLVEGAAGVLDKRDAARLAGALEPEAQRTGFASAGGGGAVGVSRGRSGDFKEELRVEPLEDGRLRIARWVLRPGTGWQVQEAPPMLPADRYAEALADARRRGVLPSMSDSGDAARL